MTIQTVSTPSGEKLVVMPMEEYDDLVDGRSHAAAMGALNTGTVETFSAEEAAEYVAAPSRLALWREMRGVTAAALAADAGLSEASLIQSETGSAEAVVRTFARLATALRISFEDIVDGH